MKFSIAPWYNNYQAPSVLMIDDLSDAYIDIYSEEYKNDWGYLCDTDKSVFYFLEKNLLEKFENIKITFFVPYARHSVINENTKHQYKKFAVGEREEFSIFLKRLIAKGHEIAHHGSNHGEYIDLKNLSSTSENFKHEWQVYSSVKEGVNITQKGIEVFKKSIDYTITGGKFCGYAYNKYALDIIDQTNFEYWCNDVNFVKKQYKPTLFGQNNIINFPTNFSGNSFVRLSYKTGDKKRDNRKKILKFFQPLYNLFAYYQLNQLYKAGHIISIQEHISPSTTSGHIQSANIVSDIKSLLKIYNSLEKKSIWYATTQEISRYIYVKNNTVISYKKNELILTFNNYKSLQETYITVSSKEYFELQQENSIYKAEKHNHLYVINTPIADKENKFTILDTNHESQ